MSDITGQLALVAELKATLEKLATAQVKVDKLRLESNQLIQTLSDGRHWQPTNEQDNASPAVVAQTTPLSESEAWALYDAGVEKRSQSQMNMIFALLAKFDIKDEPSMKAALWGIIKQQHGDMVVPESTKELSKAWASGVIDYLTKATKKDLDQWVVPF